MKYKSIKEISLIWNLSERTVRNYCASNKISGAVLQKGSWLIPEETSMPRRANEKKNKNYLLEALRQEKRNSTRGGIYHRLQIEMTYNSNHIEGSKLSHDQTRFIYETSTIAGENEAINVDDILETINHFECIDRVIDFVNYPISEKFIKELHGILKRGTSDKTCPIGEYKKLPNIVGNIDTVPPRLVKQEIKKLLDKYSSKDSHSFKEILDFHVQFERIHPFKDGNGRVGRLLVLKECLKNNIVPFIIKDENKLFYYRGLDEWGRENGYLIDTCLDGQDTFKKYLDYFKIKY